MKISQIAREAGVTQDTVRHYVALGLLKPERNPGNGYQVFSASDRHRLGFIREARSLGFRLDDIRKMFVDAANADSPCPRVRAMMAERIAETRRRIAELSALCERMEQAMADWEGMPDAVPNGREVCRLIESRIHS